MKPLLKVALLVIIVGGLAATATYAYLNRPQSKPTPTVSQSAYNSLSKTLVIHDAVAKATSDKLTDEVTTATSKLTAVCTQLKTLRQTNPACN